MLTENQELELNRSRFLPLYDLECSSGRRQYPRCWKLNSGTPKLLTLEQFPECAGKMVSVAILTRTESSISNSFVYMFNYSYFYRLINDGAVLVLTA